MAGLWDRWRRRDGEDASVPEEDTSESVSSPLEADLSVARDGESQAESAGLAEPEQSAAPDSRLIPAPVTRQRVAASLARSGYRYLTDTDGDLFGLWAYRFFSFYLVRDSVLQVRGRWSRQADVTHLWEILMFTDSWNGQHSHPKCYVRVNDDGRLHVITEVAVPIEAGLTDEQLDHQIAVGLSAGLAVFDELDRRYPDPVLQVREEDS